MLSTTASTDAVLQASSSRLSNIECEPCYPMSEHVPHATFRAESTSIETLLSAAVTSTTSLDTSLGGLKTDVSALEYALSLPWGPFSLGFP